MKKLFQYTLPFCIMLIISLNVDAQFPMPDSVCVGDLKHYNVDSNQIPGSIYFWKIDGVPQLNSSLNSIDVTWNSEGTYLVEVQEMSAEGCYGAVKSGQVFVRTVPTIMIQPANQTSCSGISATFSVIANGSDLTYQWRRGVTNLVDGGNISGATTHTLTIFPVSPSDTASDYNVVVAGPCLPNVTSSYVALTINQMDIDYLDFGNTKNAVSVYPNPFKTSLTIKLLNVPPYPQLTFIVYDLLGKELTNTQLTKQFTVLNLNSLPTGMYFFRVFDRGTVLQTGKLISK